MHSIVISTWREKDKIEAEEVGTTLLWKNWEWLAAKQTFDNRGHHAVENSIYSNNNNNNNNNIFTR